jgi:hypothetical protein
LSILYHIPNRDDPDFHYFGDLASKTTLISGGKHAPN